MRIELKAEKDGKLYTKGINIDLESDGPAKISHKLRVLFGSLEKTMAISMGVFTANTDTDAFKEERQKFLDSQEARHAVGEE